MLFAIDWPPLAKVMLAAALVFSAWHSLRKALLRSPDRVLALSIPADGRLLLQLADGEWHAARIVGGGLVSRWLIVLKLSGRSIPRSLVLPADSLADDDHRQLRVALQFGLGEAQG